MPLHILARQGHAPTRIKLIHLSHARAATSRQLPMRSLIGARLFFSLYINYCLLPSGSLSRDRESQRGSSCRSDADQHLEGDRLMKEGGAAGRGLVSCQGPPAGTPPKLKQPNAHRRAFV